jgi:GGDEF domain-containing protein
MALGYALAVFLHRPDLTNLLWPTREIVPMAPGASAAPDVPAVSSFSILSAPAATLPAPSDLAKSRGVESASESAVRVGETMDEGRETPAIDVLLNNVERETAALGAQSEPIVIGATVSAMESDLNRFSQEIGALDDDVRQHQERIQSKFLQACVAKFDDISDNYVARRDQHIESLSNSAGDDAQALAETCRAAAQRQSAAIEATRAQLTMTSSMADAAAACRAFLLATEPLAAANQAFQGELQRARSRSSDPESLDPRSPVPFDAAAARELPADLEGAVSAFVDQLPDEASRFSVALVGVDSLDSICQEHGQFVGDRILQAIAKLFTALSPAGALASDSRERQLLFCLPTIGAREMAKEVEQVRQRIGEAIFQHKTLQLRVTLSCGVAEATAEEDSPSILKRLREMQSEAERYGRNRTFFQDGHQSAPAVPPAATVKPRVIEV